MSGYDRIGGTYASTRRADPRIAALIHTPLACLGSVVNVGAGAGSYEPAHTIAAIEPSAVMIAQRPPGSPPAIQACAEAIPLPDEVTDAALAVLTVHHWADLEAGINQLRRIARRRVVILTFDPHVTRTFWLLREYLPDLAAADAAASVPLPRLLDALGGGHVLTVPIPHDCTDGFTAAYWRRPHAYLNPQVRAGMSVLATAAPTTLTVGLDRLREDLDSGLWQHRHSNLSNLSELDAGYRLIVTDLPEHR